MFFTFDQLFQADQPVQNVLTEVMCSIPNNQFQKQCLEQLIHELFFNLSSITHRQRVLKLLHAITEFCCDLKKPLPEHDSKMILDSLAKLMTAVFNGTVELPCELLIFVIKIFQSLISVASTALDYSSWLTTFIHILAIRPPVS